MMAHRREVNLRREHAEKVSEIIGKRFAEKDAAERKTGKRR
jgi:hypothetical protein